tara:strand:- start:14 stop:2386 length:2373 start_codon:yes stop_codon:yes gene_type:complete
MTEFTLTKTYDIHAIKASVASKAINKKECDKLISLYRAVKKNKTLTTTYAQKDKCGRYYPSGDNKSFADAYMWKHTRASLSLNELDIDAVNCAMTIFCSICEQAGLSVDYVRRAVDNRDFFIDDLDITQADIDNHNKVNQNTADKRGIAKQFFSAILNNGGRDVWKNSLRLTHDIVIKDSEVHELVKEIKRLKEALLSFDKYAEVKKQYGKSAAIFHIITDIEAKVTTDLIKIFQQNSIQVTSFIYDGFQVRSKDKTRINNILNGYVNQYDLQFIIKKFPLKLNKLTMVNRTDEEIKIGLAKLDQPVASTVLEVCQMVWDAFGETIKKVDGAALKYDYKAKRWKTIELNAKYVGKLISDCAIYHPIGFATKDGVDYDYLANSSGYRAVKEMIVPILEDISPTEAITDINERTVGKIFFKDKCLDMKTRKYSNITIDNAGTWNIPRNMPDFSVYHDEHPDVVAVTDKVLACWTKEELDIFLKAKSRALGGHIKDKNFYCFPGSRNSGKGICTHLDNNGLGTFPNGPCTEVTIPVNTDLDKADPKSKAFILSRNMYLARISNSNELGKEGASVNGNTLKSLAAGGDRIECEEKYKNSRSVANNCTMFFAFNLSSSGKMPVFKPADALEKAIIMEMNYAFTDDKDKIEMSPNKYRLQDNGLKDFISDRREDLGNAYIWLLLQNYTSNPISKAMLPEEMRELNEEKKLAIIDEKMLLFEEHFVIGEDFECMANQFREKMSYDMKESATATRWIKRHLRLKCPTVKAKKVDGVQLKYYKGFKLKQDIEESDKCLI